MVELKPCPFCGESVLLAVRPIHNYANEEVGADITCERCLATFRSEEATNVDEVVEHWNRRVEVKAEVLTIDQAKALGNSDYNNSYLDDAKRSFVWWESSPSARFPIRNQLWLVRLSYSFHPEWDNDESLYEIEGYVTGSEIPLSGSASEYNKTWRCWNRKPTNEQRQEVKWDGEV